MEDLKNDLRELDKKRGDYDSDLSTAYQLPPINLDHVHSMTTSFGMVRLAKDSTPDIHSGYTLDDNARALIAICKHYSLTGDESDLHLIETYLKFVEYCQQPYGKFLNYVVESGAFQSKNIYSNLEDANGRAIWAIGLLADMGGEMPVDLMERAELVMQRALCWIPDLESPRAIAFAIEGLYFYYQKTGEDRIRKIIKKLANKLQSRYYQVSDNNWQWFEEYLSDANSSLPKAMLYAYLVTNKAPFKIIAHASFSFLLSHLFRDNELKFIAIRKWHHTSNKPVTHSELPIDVSYAIQTLDLFYRIYHDESYRQKMELAFSWFLGNNRLGLPLYDSSSGGCANSLEKYFVTPNQGAESTVCFLVARLIMGKIRDENTRNIEKARSADRQLVITRPSSPKKQEV